MIQLPNPGSTLPILLSSLPPSGTPKIVVTGFAAVLAADPHRLQGRPAPTQRSPPHPPGRSRTAAAPSPAARRRGHHGHPGQGPSRPTSRGRETILSAPGRAAPPETAADPRTYATFQIIAPGQPT